MEKEINQEEIEILNKKQEESVKQTPQLGAMKNNKFNIYQYIDNKGQKLNEIEGILSIFLKKYLHYLSLIVDKQCIQDEEGMKELISLLQKNKSRIQGIVISDFEGAFKVDYLKRIELSLVKIHINLTIVNHNKPFNKLIWTQMY